MSKDDEWWDDDPIREPVLWTEDGEVPDIPWGDQLLTMSDAEFKARWNERMVLLDHYEGTGPFVYFIQLPDRTGYVGKAVSDHAHALSDVVQEIRKAVIAITGKEPNWVSRSNSI